MDRPRGGAGVRPVSVVDRRSLRGGGAAHALALGPLCDQLQWRDLQLPGPATDPRTARPELQGALRHGSAVGRRSEEHTSELQSLMRSSYAVFCLKKKKTKQN